MVYEQSYLQILKLLCKSVSDGLNGDSQNFSWKLRISIIFTSSPFRSWPRHTQFSVNMIIVRSRFEKQIDRGCYIASQFKNSRL